MNAWMLTALLPLASGEGTVPPPPPAPLLFVRVVPPDGAQVTSRPAAPEPRVAPAPAVAGFRPGYRYRFQVQVPPPAARPDLPAVVISPSMDVLSTLHVPPGLKAEDFPATLPITADDLIAITSGGLVTKVIYLEDPYQAPAVRSGPDLPVELDVLRGRDPLAEARV